MKMATHDHHDRGDDPNNSRFWRHTFPVYCRKFCPASQTRYIPATPRAYAVINFFASATPSNSDEGINTSSISLPSFSASSFFFSISSPSSSSSSPPSQLHHLRSHYRCTFRGREAIGFRRMLPQGVISSSAPEKLKQYLSAISTLRHANVVQLIGASVSEIKEPVDLIYQFIPGPTLSHCLNPNGDASADINYDPYQHVLTWKSRMEIVQGVASGLVYIHHMTGFDLGFVHNRIKSSNIILSSATSGQYSHLIRAKICSFGLSCASWSCVANDNDDDSSGEHRRPMLMEEDDEEGYPYMAPELFHQGIATQKSDVYAFGVLMLELLSGARPSTYLYEDVAAKDVVYSRTLIIETAREIFDHDDSGEEIEIEKRVRLWVDKRLNDSFPVKSTVDLLRVALMCVVEDPASRPDMVSVQSFIFQCIYSKIRRFLTH